MSMDNRVKSKILLEKLKPEHAQELFDLTVANREYLKEWLPWLDHIQSIKDTRAFIESTINSSNGSLQFAILTNGNICGVAGFHAVNKQHHIGSIGYWLAQAYSGNGIMTEAVAELLKIGFIEFSLNKIEIRCAEDNIKSRAIAERLGFTYEATLRQCEWLYTKYVDHAVYSLLAAEFNA